MKCEEKLFEKLFESIAPAYKMRYYKIPDVVAIKINGKIPISRKRFADGVLVTVNGNYFIEAKYQYGQLLDHQKITQKNINKVNSSYYVLRKKLMQKKTKTIYTVEQAHKVLFTTENMEDLFKFFQQPDEITSQNIMIEQLIPSHIRKKRKLNKTRY